MCWVMPPASPETTWVLRMASSSEVLPWSTWAHDGDHRRARDEIAGVVGVGLDEQPLLDVGLGDAADRVAHVLGDDLGGVGLDDVGRLKDLALLHEVLDDVDGALRHAVGKLGDGDLLGDDHLAHDLVARALVGARALALAAAADGGQRTGALGVVEGVDQRQLAAAAILDALDRLRLGRGLGLDATAQATRAVVGLFLGSLFQGAERRRGRPGGASRRRREPPRSWRHPRRSGGGRPPRRGRGHCPRCGGGRLPRPCGARPRCARGQGARSRRRGGRRHRRRRDAPRPRGPWRRRARGRGRRSRRWKAGGAPARREAAVGGGATSATGGATGRAGATGASTTGRTATGAGASGFSPGSVMRRFLRST